MCEGHPVQIQTHIDSLEFFFQRMTIIPFPPPFSGLFKLHRSHSIDSFPAFIVNNHMLRWSSAYRSTANPFVNDVEQPQIPLA